MGKGATVLASLWLSAWRAADIPVGSLDLAPIAPADIERTYVDKRFLPSYTLDKIAAHLDG